VGLLGGQFLEARNSPLTRCSAISTLGFLKGGVHLLGPCFQPEECSRNETTTEGVTAGWMV
jgi:hypothetical protein